MKVLYVTFRIVVRQNHNVNRVIYIPQLHLYFSTQHTHSHTTPLDLRQRLHSVLVNRPSARQAQLTKHAAPSKAIYHKVFL
jgi:hypothetical protein